MCVRARICESNLVYVNLLVFEIERHTPINSITVRIICRVLTTRAETPRLLQHMPAHRFCNILSNYCCS